MLNSDIYIMIPVGGNINDKILLNTNKDDIIDEYIDKMIKTSLYECDNKVSNALKRTNYGIAYLSYYESDNYYDDSKRWIPCNIVYTYNESTSLGIMQLLINYCEEEDSQIGDMISSNHLSIKINEDEYALNDFLKELSLKQYGKMRTINCNSIDKKDKTMKYTLIAETAYSEHNPYHINDNYFEKIGIEDYSKYNFYELYADEKTVVYLLKKFSSNYQDNIDEEALLIFICEIAIFQNAAVSRINAQIVDELVANSNISSRRSLKLQIEYGKTILFWNNNIFNYHAAQDLSNDIVNAFRNKELMEEYKKNSKHLEQIANLKSGIQANVEARVLNILAFILSVSQLFEIINNVRNVLNGKEWQIGLTSSSIILLIIIILIVRNNLKSKKNRI